MIYEVSIGTHTRKGKFQEAVSCAVEFDGSESRLEQTLGQKYQGMFVKVFPVNKVGKIMSPVPAGIAANYKHYILKNRQSFQLCFFQLHRRDTL